MKMFKRVLIIAVLIIFASIAASFLFSEKLYNLSMNMQRSSAGLDKKELAVGDDKIVYYEGGSGSGTIVLLHGFGADKDNWTKMVKFLPGYHYIIPDLPGFGESSKSDSAKYDVNSQVDRLDKFFTKIGADKFYIAGNSMGGNISGIYAIRYPQKVKALILVNNAGVKSPVNSDAYKSIERGVNPLIVNNVDDFKNLLKYVFYKEPFIPYPVKKILAEKSITNRKFNEKVFKDIMTSPAMFEDHFPEFTMPVLIIWGDSDRLLDVSSVSVLEKGIKNHTTKILKECGHMPMVERPEETAGYIKSFIDSHK